MADYDGTTPDLTVGREEVVATTESGIDLRSFIRTPRRANLGTANLVPNSRNIPYLRDIIDSDPIMANVADRVLNAPLSTGTMSNYDAVIKDFTSFCVKFRYNPNTVSEQSIIHFLLNVEHEQRGFAYCSKIKPALELHGQLAGKPLQFSATLNRLMQGVKNLSAERRLPTKKAQQLSLETIRHLVHKEVTTHKDNIRSINLITFRTIFRVVIEYYLFARFDDFSKLKAKHFYRYYSPNYIVVNFPHRKNDQHHQGFESVLVEKPDMCPVHLTDLYFKCIGLTYGNSRTGIQDEGFVNCRIRKSGPHQSAETSQCLSRTTATEDLRDILRKNGLPWQGVTDKSAKAEGVTKSLDQGADLLEVQLHGGWKSQFIPLHYKHNSIEYKRKIADNVPDSYKKKTVKPDE